MRVDIDLPTFHRLAFKCFHLFGQNHISFHDYNFDGDTQRSNQLFLTKLYKSPPFKVRHIDKLNNIL